MEKVTMYDTYRSSEFYSKTYMSKYELFREKDAELISLKKQRSGVALEIASTKMMYMKLIVILIGALAMVLFIKYTLIVLALIVGAFFIFRNHINSMFKKGMLVKEIISLRIKAIALEQKLEDSTIEKEAIESFLKSV